MHTVLRRKVGAREFCPKQSSTSSELKVQSGELYETDK